MTFFGDEMVLFDTAWVYLQCFTKMNDFQFAVCQLLKNPGLGIRDERRVQLFGPPKSFIPRL